MYVCRVSKANVRSRLDKYEIMGYPIINVTDYKYCFQIMKTFTYFLNVSG